MRFLAGGFGLVCGMVIIAVTSRYGFKTADNDIDGYIWAFLYGMIAFGGLFGHALAVRLWRAGKVAAVLVGIGCALALTLNLSNSLGAMAGRGNETAAARVKIAQEVRDARRSLLRAEEERLGLQYTPTDKETVEAAQRASIAASASREAECTKRGDRCREREADERNALAHLATLTSHKATTERAASLDAAIAGLRAQLERAGPVLEANPQGAAFARMFNLPETTADFLSTWQNFAMAIAAELLIVLSMVAFEVLRPTPTASSSTEHVATKLRIVETSPETAPASKSARVASTKPALVLSTPPKPQLVASRQEPIGRVATIMADLMEVGPGRVEFAEAFAAYASSCRQNGKRIASVEDFSIALKRLCGEVGIKLKSEGDNVYLMRVRLKDGGEAVAMQLN
jgi:hypothetical protein